MLFNAKKCFFEIFWVLKCKKMFFWDFLSWGLKPKSSDLNPTDLGYSKVSVMEGIFRETARQTGGDAPELTDYLETTQVGISNSEMTMPVKGKGKGRKGKAKSGSIHPCSDENGKLEAVRLHHSGQNANPDATMRLWQVQSGRDHEMPSLL